MTRAIRTYSSTGGVELVPGIAAEFGLRVTVGAWIDKDEDRNEREIRSAIDLARRHSNVNGVVVGNETIYRDDQTVPELIKKIQRVKRATNVPVTTGEIWSVWVEHPELVSAVDYIAAHILPYWEGFSAKQAVDQAILIYDKLRRVYPGKRIVIAEFGWPSAGYNLKNADPGRIEQAQVLRDFVSRADAYGIDYNIVEAIDQPWKTFEGGVGPYWGLFDAARQPKFAWTGPITDPDHWRLAGIALLVGVLLSLPILAMHGVTLRQAVHARRPPPMSSAPGRPPCSPIGTAIISCPAPPSRSGSARVLLVPLVVIALARIEEIAAIAFGRKPRRLIAAPPLAPEHDGAESLDPYPGLSRAAGDAEADARCGRAARLPEFRMRGGDQQHARSGASGCRSRSTAARSASASSSSAPTTSPASRPARCGSRMMHTAADAEIIGVIDADYVVQPEWLKDLVPLFRDPTVGLVQAPQDHRDGGRSLMHHAMNGEYAGFFDIGMVQRNEPNAIIVHGTMCLIRRAALEAAGGWSSDTICEDTDLGLTLLEHGWHAHYTNRRYGHGLLPDTFEAYKKQRHRWAYGGFQIVKKHWRRFLPGASRLTREQKREFALGWLDWLGAERLGVVVAILNIIWVPVVAFLDIAVPDRILTLPIIASFAVSLVHFVALYRLRVRAGKGQMLGAVFAAMSVQWTVARAVGIGLVKDHLPFVRTAKGGLQPQRPISTPSGKR